MSNFKISDLHTYIVKVAEKELNKSSFLDTVTTGTITASLPGYYQVSLANSGDVSSVSARPINDTTYAVNDYVYILRAPARGGENFTNSYYIFGKANETEEAFVNLTTWERLTLSDIKETAATNTLVELTNTTWTFNSSNFINDIKTKGYFAITAYLTAGGSQDFGLKIDIKDGSNIILETFYFDKNYFTGSVSKLVNAFQKRVCNLSEVAKSSVAKVVITGFNNTTGTQPKLQDLCLTSGSLYETVNNFEVKISTLPGHKNFFRNVAAESEGQDQIGLKATLYYNNQPIAADAIKYYWCVQDDSIVSVAGEYYEKFKEGQEEISKLLGDADTEALEQASAYYKEVLDNIQSTQYNALIGPGWKCLNGFSNVDFLGSSDIESVKVWNSSNTMVIDEFSGKFTNELGQIINSNIGTGVNFPFGKIFETTVKCFVKYNGYIIASEEFKVLNYSKHNFSASLRLSNGNDATETQRISKTTDKVGIVCDVKASQGSQDFPMPSQMETTYQWYIKIGDEDITNTFIDGDDEEGDSTLVINGEDFETNYKGIIVKDEQTSSSKKGYFYRDKENKFITIELPEENSDGEDISDSTFNIYAKVFIKADGADSAIILTTDEIKVQSATHLEHELRSAYNYKYYLSESMNVTFGKSPRQEEGADIEGSWSGDWNIYDADVSETNRVWTSITIQDTYDFEKNEYNQNGLIALNNIRPPVTEDSIKNQYYIYYTKQEVVYRYENGATTRTVWDEKNWSDPLCLNLFEYKNNSWVSTRSAKEIEQINIFNQLTNGGTEQGIKYNTDAEDGKSKLYINADFINTGTLRVGASSPESVKFYASIENNKVGIAGWEVDENSLTKGTVGISSNSGSDNKGIAFWAGSETAAAAPFRVTHDGTVVANSITIGGSSKINGEVISASGIATGENLSDTKKALEEATGEVKTSLEGQLQTAQTQINKEITNKIDSLESEKILFETGTTEDGTNCVILKANPGLIYFNTNDLIINSENLKLNHNGSQYQENYFKLNATGLTIESGISSVDGSSVTSCSIDGSTITAGSVNANQMSTDLLMIGASNILTPRYISTYDDCSLDKLDTYVYKLTTRAQYSGIEINSELFAEGQSYILSYKFSILDGTIARIGGHCSGFTINKAIIDGVTRTWSYAEGYPINSELEEHTVQIYCTYNGNTDNNNLYIQPKRSGENSSFACTVKIWDLQVVIGAEEKTWTIPSDSYTLIDGSNLMTDALKSKNYKRGIDPYYSAYGSFFDLSQGNITTPNFSIDAANKAAYFSGSITATQGNIGGLTIENNVIKNNSNSIEIFDTGVISINELKINSLSSTLDASKKLSFIYDKGGFSGEKSETVSVSSSTTSNVYDIVFSATPPSSGLYSSMSIYIRIESRTYNEGMAACQEDDPYDYHADYVSISLSSGSKTPVSVGAFYAGMEYLGYTIYNATMTPTLNNYPKNIAIDGNDISYTAPEAKSDFALQTEFSIVPSGELSLGTSGNPWAHIYSANGIVEKSDKNEKNSIVKISDSYSQMFDKLVPVSYRFNENTSDRTHIGFIAQEVEQALLDTGLTTQDFAGICYWDKEDGTKGYGLRYTEFIALNTHEIQKLKKRVIEQDQRILELEEKILNFEKLIQTNGK